MKSDMEKTNRRLSKAETAVLVLFGISLATWIANKFVNVNWLLTLSMTTLFVASVTLFVLVLMALMQKKETSKKGKK